MMKVIKYLFVFLLLSCNSENAFDCFQSEGEIIQEVVAVPSFSKIRIEDDVSLVIQQGATQEVMIETGSNLRNDVTVEVKEGILIVKDNNRCNFVRDYGVTKAIVTTPVLEEIRNSSEFDVVGKGVLNFPFLRLVSNTTGNVEDSRKSGDFSLKVQCEDLRIEANGFSGFYMEGFAEKATFAFEDEIPLLQARKLLVNDLHIFQRSANKMVVHPVEKLSVIIKGTGDVISVNRPPMVEVEEFYTGQLIFED